jgi:broad-specificity NMP kinase
MNEIIIGTRGTGKTTKLIQIMQHCRDVILVVSGVHNKRLLNNIDKDLEDRVISINELINNKIAYRGKRIIIDDIDECIEF